MSIWGKYFTTPVSVRAFAGRNDSGDPSFEESTTVLCRVEFKRGHAINSTGEQIASEIKLFSAEPIPAGSMVTVRGLEWPVISCYEAVGLNGETDHYETRA